MIEITNTIETLGLLTTKQFVKDESAFLSRLEKLGYSSENRQKIVHKYERIVHITLVLTLLTLAERYSDVYEKLAQNQSGLDKATEDLFQFLSELHGDDMKLTERLMSEVNKIAKLHTIKALVTMTDEVSNDAI